MGVVAEAEKLTDERTWSQLKTAIEFGCGVEFDDTFEKFCARRSDAERKSYERFYARCVSDGILAERGYEVGDGGAGAKRIVRDAADSANVYEIAVDMAFRYVRKNEPRLLGCLIDFLGEFGFSKDGLRKLRQRLCNLKYRRAKRAK